MPPTREQLLDSVRGCAGILSLLSDRIDGEVFEAAGDQLKVVSNFAVGYNNIDVAEAKRRGIAVGNTPRCAHRCHCRHSCRTHFGSSSAIARGLAERHRRRLENLGNRWAGSAWTCVAKRWVLSGMGRIGQATAERLVRGWGMNLLYTSRSPKPEVERELNGRHVELKELFQRSDFISVHVALSPDTRQLINAELLGCMQPSAVLVNTARGEVIDQAALISALSQHNLFAAGPGCMRS